MDDIQDCLHTGKNAHSLYCKTVYSLVGKPDSLISSKQENASSGVWAER